MLEVKVNEYIVLIGGHGIINGSDEVHHGEIQIKSPDEKIVIAYDLGEFYDIDDIYEAGMPLVEQIWKAKDFNEVIRLMENY